MICAVTESMIVMATPSSTPREKRNLRNSSQSQIPGGASSAREIVARTIGMVHCRLSGRGRPVYIWYLEALVGTLCRRQSGRQSSVRQEQGKRCGWLYQKMRRNGQGISAGRFAL